MAVNSQNKRQDNPQDLQDKNSQMLNNQNTSKNTSDANMSEHASLRIAIIGGGLTGLITSSLLEKQYTQSNQPINITIFEKSAGVGRLATRYKQKDDSELMWQFDFGAQFFTAKSEAFKQYLQPWLKAQVIEPWLARTAAVDTDSTAKNIELTGQWSDNQPRYISTPKMTSFGRALAQSLKQTTLTYRTRIAPLNDSNTINDSRDLSNKPSNKTVTTLFDEQGNQLGSFDWVVCTAPQAQAIELMAKSSFEHKPAIEKPEMLACYSLMLGWGSKESLPESLQFAKWGVLEVDNKAENSQSSNQNPLGRVFIEHHKPGREHLLPSLTIHSSNNWAQIHVDDDIDNVKRGMLVAAKALFNWDEKSEPEHIDCHRWRYAATQLPNTSENIAYVDTTKQWIVTGDWCDEGRIESCFKAATQVVDLINHSE